MIIVYPDSNPLWGDLYLGGKHAQAIRKSLLSSDGQFVFSPVVVRELRRQADDVVENAVKQCRTALDDANKQNAVVATAVHASVEAFASSLKTDVNKRFAALFASAEVAVINMPVVTASQLVERELLRARPTLVVDGQSVGLRDTVIWLGLKEVLADYPEDRVVFVTKDGGFVENGALHPQLIEELKEDGIDGKHLMVVPSLFHAEVEVSRYTKAITEREAAIKLALSRFSDSLSGEDFGWYFDPREGALVESRYPLDLPMSLEQTQLLDIEYVGNEVIGDDSPASCTHELLLTFEGDMHRDAWLDNTEPDVELYLSSISEAYVSVTVERRVIVETSVTYDEASQQAEVDEYHIGLI